MKVQQLKGEVEALKQENREWQRKYKELNDQHLLEVVRAEDLLRKVEPLEERVAQLEQELLEREDEQEPMAQKIQYLTALIRDKDKEISLLKIQYE